MKAVFSPTGELSEPAIRLAKQIFPCDTFETIGNGTPFVDWLLRLTGNDSVYIHYLFDIVGANESIALICDLILQSEAAVYIRLTDTAMADNRTAVGKGMLTALSLFDDIPRIQKLRSLNGQTKPVANKILTDPKHVERMFVLHHIEGQSIEQLSAESGYSFRSIQSAVALSSKAN